MEEFNDWHMIVTFSTVECLLKHGLSVVSNITAYPQVACAFYIAMH